MTVTILLFLFGLIVGSFLNVVAIRTLKGESIAFPPSHCVHCNHRLHAADLVPLFSWLWLRGKCRYCRGPISVRYPLGELGAGLLFALTYAQIGWRPELAGALFFVSILVIVTQTDLDRMLIPNSVVAIGAAGAALFRVWEHPYPYWQHAVGLLAGSGILLLLGWLWGSLLKKEAMGMGDVKLYAFVGLFLGLKLTLLSLFAASLLGCLYGIWRIARDSNKAQQVFPFGPFIAAGALLVYWWGESLVDRYMNLVI